MPEHKQQAAPVERGDVYDTLRTIVKRHQHQHVTFRDGIPVRVDVQTARVMLQVHDLLNDEHKAKAREMMRTADGFGRFALFAWSRVRGEA